MKSLTLSLSPVVAEAAVAELVSFGEVGSEVYHQFCP